MPKEKFERLREAEKRDYLELLLLADPERAMLERYLTAGDMYLMRQGDAPVGAAVVLRLEGERCELKNLAVAPEYQRRGCGGRLVRRLFQLYAGDCAEMLVGTGDCSRGTLCFYQKLGFTYSHTVEQFFIEHYPEPIFEDGLQLRDMIYLKRNLREKPCFVYMLECEDGSLYTGWTNNLAERMRAHAGGMKGAKYTRSNPPVRLAFCEWCPDRSHAMRREAAIKRLSRAQKLALTEQAASLDGIFYHQFADTDL